MSRPPTLPLQPPPRPHGAFTLVEILVAMVVLVLLIGLITQLFTSAQKATGLCQRHMETDEQARVLFDRMAIDITQMVKRADVDYFLKDAARHQAGNDQLAFYSQVPGYGPDTSLSPFSVVGYRVNNTTGNSACNKLQRFGCALLWNGYTTSGTSMVYLPATLATHWLAATNMDDDSSHYELAGPEVFRFEYYYVLKGQAVGSVSLGSTLSALPWDNRSGVSHTAANGLQDVAAIGVVIAVMGPKAQRLVQPQDLARLAGAMDDFDAAQHADPGALEAAWQKEINASGLPCAAISTIRVYRRWFYLSPSPFSNP